MPQPFATFPTPIQDELPYSMLARYAANMPGSRFVMAEAFGTTNPILATLPTGLATFKQVAFQGRMSMEKLIAEHTGLPYLTSLMPLERRQEYINHFLPDLPEGASTRYSRRAGLRGTTPHSVLLFCPGCVENDLWERGEAAWRRTHQMAGVVVCPFCAAPLRLSNAKSFTKVLRTCPVDPYGGSELPRVMECPLALRIARCVQELLETPLNIREPGVVQRAMWALITGKKIDLASRKAAPAFAKRVVREVSASPLVWGKISAVELLKSIKAVWRPADNDDHRTPTPLPVVAVLATLDLTAEDLRRTVDNAPHRPEEIAGEVRRTGVGVARGTNAGLPPPRSDLIERHRERILRLLKPGERPEAGALWVEAPGPMRYLSRHDRAWLKEQHAPYGPRR